MPVKCRILITLACLGIAAGPAQAKTKTYYVAANGSDRHAGTTPARAWQTIARVNRAPLKPGDRVLFRGGDPFADAPLVPPASGTARAPIVFGSYGAPRARLHHSGAAVWFSGLHNVTFQ